MKFTNDNTVVDRNGKVIGEVKKTCRDLGNGISNYSHALVIGSVKLYAWDLMELCELLNSIGMVSPFQREESNKADSEVADAPVKKKRHRRTKAEMEAARAAGEVNKKK